MVYIHIMYTVGQLSKIAGITIRALRYYDKLGILKPSSIGGNGYRYYDDQNLIILQEIMLYRELDLSLEQIKNILGSRDFEVLPALLNHKENILNRIDRLNILVGTIDQTISHLKGEINMNKNQLFSGFSEEEQERYAAEAENLYDKETVRQSNRKWKSYSDQEKKRILDEGKAIYKEMVNEITAGPASSKVQALVERWRQHMNYFWTPDLDQLVGLAALYNDDPRFKANYDLMHPELASFMLKAVTYYVEKQKSTI